MFSGWETGQNSRQGTPATPLLGWSSPGIYKVDCSRGKQTRSGLELPRAAAVRAWDSLSSLASLQHCTSCLRHPTPVLPQEVYELPADLTLVYYVPVCLHY